VAQLSEPTLGARYTRRVHAVRGAELAYCLGQIVAHGAVRKAQPLRDFLARCAIAGEPQYLSLAISEWVGLTERLAWRN
jgi:hypothetical protein